MKNKAAGLVLVLMFAMAVGAGVVAGKLSSRPSGTTIAERATLTDELQLDANQRVQMQNIWEGVQRTSRESIAEAERVQRRQDADLLAMLTDEQKARWSSITIKNKGIVEGLDAKRQTAFKEAVERTKALLNGSQRKTYEQIIRGRRVMPDTNSLPMSPNMDQ